MLHLYEAPVLGHITIRIEKWKKFSTQWNYNLFIKIIGESSSSVLQLLPSKESIEIYIIQFFCLLSLHRLKLHA